MGHLHAGRHGRGRGDVIFGSKNLNFMHYLGENTVNVVAAGAAVVTLYFYEGGRGRGLRAVGILQL